MKHVIALLITIFVFALPLQSTAGEQRTDRGPTEHSREMVQKHGPSDKGLENTSEQSAFEREGGHPGRDTGMPTAQEAYQQSRDPDSEKGLGKEKSAAGNNQ
jgi:hypothetical protein